MENDKTEIHKTFSSKDSSQNSTVFTSTTSLEDPSVEEKILDDGTLGIFLSGALSVKTRRSPFPRIKKIIDQSESQSLLLDLERVSYIDSSGIAMIASVNKICTDKNISFKVHGEDQKITALMDLLDMKELVREPSHDLSKKKTGALVSLGEHTLLFFHNIRFIIVFVGEILIALYDAVKKPKRLRFGDMFKSMEVHGVNALPIITMINFLVGMVLAFQAAIQLKQFGANIYVANLVGLAQTREFGPMITAIILTGRSGSAFAAEIGSMMVNEEVDALKTMGLDPVRFLVVPKVLALLIALPLLAFYADIMGILGGLFVGVLGLDLTVQGFLLQLQGAVDLFDVFSGILKTFAFAMIIAGVGCLRGFQVRGGADSVGQAATSAVVSGIFLIILVDAIFAVIYEVI